MSETNNQLLEKEQYFSGDSVPRPLGFYAVDANPS